MNLRKQKKTWRWLLVMIMVMVKYSVWGQFPSGNLMYNIIDHEAATVELYVPNGNITTITHCTIPENVTLTLRNNDGSSYTKTFAVVRIKSGGFHGCSNLQEITIPKFISEIKDNTFWGCHALSKIVLHENVINIGSSAFRECKKLISIKLPNNLETIGDLAFMDCEKLENIKIPKKVTRIQRGTFNNCSKLETISLHNQITEILEAFRYCTSLKEIQIPEKVTNVSGYTFIGCSNLQTVILSPNTTQIGEYAFNQCESLAQIENTLNIRYLENYTFKNCKSLTTIKLPKLEKLGWGTFSGCSSLLKIPSGVELPPSIYEGCSSLTEIEIPGNITAIENYAFKNCTQLETIKLSNNIRCSPGVDIFAGCSNIKKVYISRETPPLYNIPIASVSSEAILIVPKGCKNNYINWGGFDQTRIIEEGEIFYYIEGYLTQLTTTPSLPFSVEKKTSLTLSLIPNDITRSKYKYPNNIIIRHPITYILHNNYTYDKSSGTLVIKNITSDLEIIATSTLFDFNFLLTNIKEASIVYPSQSGEQLTFTLTADKHYNLPTSIEVTMGQTTLQATRDYDYDSVNGNVTIHSVTDNIIIKALAIRDKGYFILYNLPNIETTFLTDFIWQGSDLQETMKPRPNQKLPEKIIISIGGKIITNNYVYNASTGQLVVYDIIGDVIISDASTTSIVSYELDNLTTNGPSIIAKKATLSFKLQTTTDNYKLPSLISVLMDNQELDRSIEYNYDMQTGNVSIPNVSGNVIIKAKGRSYASIAVSEFTYGDLIYVITGEMRAKVKHPKKSDIKYCDIPKSITYAWKEEPDGDIINEMMEFSITGIGEEAFKDCQLLESLNIPETIKKIENKAFNGCINLTDITIKRNTPPALGESVFIGLTNCTLYVPKGCLENYSSWKELIHIVEKGSPSIEDFIIEKATAYSKIHENCNIIVRPNITYTINEQAKLNKLILEDGAQVVLNKAELLVYSSFQVCRNLQNKWTTFTVPTNISMKPANDFKFNDTQTEDTYWVKYGYINIELQQWAEWTAQSGSIDHFKPQLPYLIAGNKANVQAAIITFPLDEKYPIVFNPHLKEYDYKSSTNVTNGNWFQFVPNPFLDNLHLKGNVYVLNKAGTSFDLQTDPIIPPFHCYMIASKVMTNKVKSLKLSNTATGVENISDNGFRTYVNNRKLYIESNNTVDIEIYTTSGSLIKKWNGFAGQEQITLPQGVYIIVCGQTAYKVIL